ncbi:cupin domain-containing protein [Alkalicaulis satelles]|uniref:Cupin domain-containing protein n=1 Tax=Alkalicaulis satelles TaxID=2609175 RepID=A0A5M6ZIY5_9PROT|nr:cupin domain-containing protein [Alkalicaulis satelles]KAA5804772.1 cupin domain-containing protein [Alkalicaulis satelles]
MPHPLFLTSAAAAAALIAAPGAQALDDHHVLIQSGEFEYMPGPGSLEAGAEFAILYGHPGEDGVFAMRLRLPDGFHIAPHTHGQPEIVTVISGTFHIGMGEDADIETATALEAGGFFAFPPGMVHFAYAEGETVVQLNSTGPWTITYIRDEDDPRLR